MVDQYPYTAHTPASACSCRRGHGDGDSAFAATRARAGDCATASSAASSINILNDRGGGDLARVQFSRVAWDRSLEGKTLADWAAREARADTGERRRCS